MYHFLIWMLCPVRYHLWLIVGSLWVLHMLEVKVFCMTRAVETEHSAVNKYHSISFQMLVHTLIRRTVIPIAFRVIRSHGGKRRREAGGG